MQNWRIPNLNTFIVVPDSSTNRQTISKLNDLRREAVKLREAGKTLAETQQLVGLSAPTIISACKAYRAGGWDAVDVGARGRPKLEAARPDLDTFRIPLIEAATAGATSQLWTIETVTRWLALQGSKTGKSTVSTLMSRWNLVPTSRYRQFRAKNHLPQAGNKNPGWLQQHQDFARTARRNNNQVLWLSSREVEPQLHQLFAHDLRGSAFWILVKGTIQARHYQQFFSVLHERFEQGVALVLPNAQLVRSQSVAEWLSRTDTKLLFINSSSDSAQTTSTTVAMNMPTPETDTSVSPTQHPVSMPTLTHLQRLEAESIHILREVVAEAENPVMMYSIGKDSAVMLHLARKAFFPATPPFPLLHVDTTWKFKAMYEFRESITEKYGLELIRHVNPEGLAQNVNPFTHGSSLHTDIMKTQGLKQALDEHRFDFAFGGARRDEEKSRAKERVFSFRSAQHRWDAKNQRPELWQLYNTRKQRDESIRVFPLSNWTELDIWQYIHKEDIPIVPLYLAAERPVVERDGALIMVDDDRMPLNKDEVPQMRSVRFRTLGCYPLTGAIESTASTLEEIIQEMLLARTSERQGRMIDHDSAASMEKKKQEGYF